MIPASMTKSKKTEIDEAEKQLLANYVCVRMRGLPYRATEDDVRTFMRGLMVVEIQFLHNFTGKSKGEAFVKFANHMEALKAMDRNKEYIGNRWIEIFPASELEMAHVAQAPPANGCKVLKMRGLPWTASEDDIREFFNGIPISPGAIQILYFPDGRSTGEAFVTFEDEKFALEAVRKHKHPMGSRYVELFPSTAGEADSALSAAGQEEYLQNELTRKREHMNRLRAQEQHYFRLYGTFPSSHKPEQAASNHVVKLRGLPFSCDELDIATFFAGLNILQRGIHLVYNNADKPTGHAFVEFKTAADVKAALLKNKSAMGHRWVEVFQSSNEELQQAYGLSALTRKLKEEGNVTPNIQPPAWLLSNSGSGDFFFQYDASAPPSAPPPPTAEGQPQFSPSKPAEEAQPTPQFHPYNYPPSPEGSYSQYPVAAEPYPPYMYQNYPPVHTYSVDAVAQPV